MTTANDSSRGAFPAERVGQVLVSLADTLADDFDLADYLHRLTGHCLDLVGADGAGVMLADDDGTLRLLASSSENTRRLEQSELDGADGPCVAAYHSGDTIAHARLGPAEDRWNNLSAPAHAAGFRCAHAIPLRRGDAVIGALNLFSRTGEPLPQHEQQLARALADMTTISLLQQRALTKHRTLADQLQQAFTTRLIIEQAKGVLAERHNISVAHAFERLRRHSRNTQQKLAGLAHDVVEGTTGEAWGPPEE